MTLTCDCGLDLYKVVPSVGRDWGKGWEGGRASATAPKPSGYRSSGLAFAKTGIDGVNAVMCLTDGNDIRVFADDQYQAPAPASQRSLHGEGKRIPAENLPQWPRRAESHAKLLI